jgi:hypothetical protein
VNRDHDGRQYVGIDLHRRRSVLRRLGANIIAVISNYTEMTIETLDSPNPDPASLAEVRNDLGQVSRAPGVEVDVITGPSAQQGGVPVDVVVEPWPQVGLGPGVELHGDARQVSVSGEQPQQRAGLREAGRDAPAGLRVGGQHGVADESKPGSAQRPASSRPLW